MNKKIVLSSCAFMLAIGGAFASQLLTPIQGYSKLGVAAGEVPTQTLACEPQEQCDIEGQRPCFNTVVYTIGGVNYAAGTVALFDLDSEEPLICETQLKRF